jgi:hypothetical protein
MPPRGDFFCFACAAVWKHEALARVADQVAAAVKAGGETTIALGKGLTPPALAVAYGLFAPLIQPPLGNGMMPFPVPLCWSHLLGLNLTETAIMPAHPGMIPTGPGGAVMLDRR